MYSKNDFQIQWKKGTTYLELMCNQYDGFSLQLLLNAFFKDMFAHMGVNSRKRIVKEEDVFIGVDSSGQADPLLLPPWQIQPPLSYLPTTQQEEQSIDHMVW